MLRIVLQEHNKVKAYWPFEVIIVVQWCKKTLVDTSYSAMASYSVHHLTLSQNTNVFTKRKCVTRRCTQASMHSTGDASL